MWRAVPRPYLRCASIAAKGGSHQGSRHTPKGNAMFEILTEDVVTLEDVGVAEGCCTSTSSCSLDICDVEFE